MNIFKYDGEEFDKKLNEIFNNIDSSTLKNELIECGLVIEDNLYISDEYLKCVENIEYSNKKKIKLKIDYEEYSNNKENKEERNVLWKNNQELLVA